MKVGDRLERGQRVGMIKFGSRVDVLMPADAVPKVKSGSRVRGGSTVLAVLPQPVGDGARCRGWGVLMAAEQLGLGDLLRRRAKRHPSRGMYVLPSLFTAGNIAAGYYAITQSVQGSAADPWLLRSRGAGDWRGGAVRRPGRADCAA